jgi:hypothetical protein
MHNGAVGNGPRFLRESPTPAAKTKTEARGLAVKHP